MVQLFHMGGPFMWPLLVMSTTIIVLSVKRIIDLSGQELTDINKIKHGVNSILFWGIMSVVTGILGQLSGIYAAINEIVKATDISPQVTLQGFGISFITTLLGLWIFILTAIVWFSLRYVLYKKSEKISGQNSVF